MRNNKITPKRYKIKYFLIVPRTPHTQARTQNPRTENRKARASQAKNISFHSTPTKPHRREPRSAGRFEEKQRGRAERKEWGPITCAAFRGVPGRRAAGVVGGGGGAGAGAGWEVGASLLGFGGCLST